MRAIKLPDSAQNYLTRLKQLPQQRLTSLLILAIAGLLAILYLLYSLLFLGQVYPKVMIGSVSFAGLNHAQALAKLEQLNKSLPDQPIVIRYKDSSYQLLPKEIDWRVDNEATVEKLLAVGRDDNNFLGLWQQISAPFHRQVIEPTVNYDQQSIEAFIRIISEQVDVPAVNATAEISGTEINFTREKSGSVIDSEELVSTIINQWLRYETEAIEIETMKDEPEVVLGDTKKIREQVELLSQKQLRISYLGINRQLTRTQIRKLIGFVGSEQVETTPKPLEAKFTLDQSKKYLEELASLVNQEPVEPRLVIINGKLAVAEASRPGRVIDVSASAKLLFDALKSPTEEVKTVELKIVTKEPVITEDNLESLGIKERIGVGVTDFAGSPTNRRLNIINGVKLLQSALIKPGGEFSTVNTLGEVDASTGFLPELVIKDNRTIPEYGGGLCQVSTTLFRSVLNAGLKVTARQNHSYRVSYYEPPIGLDATIYLPLPDFKFSNDTKAHILVQGRVEGNKVYFELWGTSDGRSSTISNTKIISTTPAGKPIYAKTDTLLKGVTKQIERAHDGAVTTVTYTVKRNGKVINTQIFRSVYKAWPARYLVGTKEPPQG